VYACMTGGSLQVQEFLVYFCDGIMVAVADWCCNVSDMRTCRLGLSALPACMFLHSLCMAGCIPVSEYVTV